MNYFESLQREKRRHSIATVSIFDEVMAQKNHKLVVIKFSTSTHKHKDIILKRWMNVKDCSKYRI